MPSFIIRKSSMDKPGGALGVASVVVHAPTETQAAEIGAERLKVDVSQVTSVRYEEGDDAAHMFIQGTSKPGEDIEIVTPGVPDDPVFDELGGS